jgi:hypothetical protein
MITIKFWTALAFLYIWVPGRFCLKVYILRAIEESYFESKGFWWRWMTLRITRFMDLVLRPELHIIKKYSMVWVRERTIPTERPLLVGEVIANLCGERVPRGQRDRSLRLYSRFSRQEPLLFYQVAPQLYSRGWVDSVPDPLLFFWKCRESNPCLRICSQELWPLDHRGVLTYN